LKLLCSKVVDNVCYENPNGDIKLEQDVKRSTDSCGGNLRKKHRHCLLWKSKSVKNQQHYYTRKTLASHEKECILRTWLAKPTPQPSNSLPNISSSKVFATELKTVPTIKKSPAINIVRLRPSFLVTLEANKVATNAAR